MHVIISTGRFNKIYARYAEGSIFMSRVTIKDVAKHAGVSKSTVSHVINNTRHVEEDTKRRVMEAIDALGYHPSSVARSLISKRTKTAGLLISDIGNPFYSDVILGVEEIALENGYQIFLCNTSYDIDRGIKFVYSLVEKQVDGVLCMSSSLSEELVLELSKNHVPAVVLDWEDAELNDHAATIKIDFERGISGAVNHLVELGHENIAHISGPLHLWTSRVRRDLFFKALEQNGIDPKEAVVIEGNLRIDGGRKALEELTARPQRPTAVFAANDLSALGIIWSARDKGIRIPEDLSVIGVDNIDLGSQATPPLTTVALPRYEIGCMAMETLLELLESSKKDPQELQYQQKTIATRLVIRQSTAKPMSREAW